MFSLARFLHYHCCEVFALAMVNQFGKVIFGLVIVKTLKLVVPASNVAQPIDRLLNNTAVLYLYIVTWLGIVSGAETYHSL